MFIYFGNIVISLPMGIFFRRNLANAEGGCSSPVEGEPREGGPREGLVRTGSREGVRDRAPRLNLLEERLKEELSLGTVFR